MIVKNVFNKLQKKICSPFYDSVPSLSTQQILSLLSDAIPNFSWWKCPNIVVKNNFNQLQKENFSWRCPTIVHHCPILSPLSDAIPNFPGRRSGSPSKARLPRPNPSLMSLQNKQIGLPPSSSLFSAGQTRSLQGSVPIKKLFHKGWFPSLPCLKLDM